jgi:hypothetical protein
LDAAAATYLILLAAFLDIGTAQNPMFGSVVSAGWAHFLPPLRR